jgi:hypothetical protein
MGLLAGSVTVTSVSAGSPVTGVSTGLAGALFTARYPAVKVQMDNADTATSTAPVSPDPDLVRKYIQGISPLTYGSPDGAADMSTALTNVAGFANTGPWPAALCIPPPAPMNRLVIYQGLAADCVVWASAIIPYLTSAAVIPAGSLLDHGGLSCSGSTVLT